MGKPTTVDDYRKWLKEHLNVDVTHRDKTYYDQVVVGMKADLEKSIFWGQLVNNLAELKDRYRLERGYDLYTSPDAPRIVTKPFDSFFLKTFRKNILLNAQWPEAPPHGWITPENWLTKTNDVLRTLLVVKFLDGVEYVSDSMRNCCHHASIPCRVDFEAREEGYYAAHFYVKNEFEIPRMDWDTQRVQVETELQITTQLQESIRRLLHHYYETRRLNEDSNNNASKKWQWQYKSDEFAANYLGHILHYVEGMIMDIRDKQERTTI
jgi:hypothetical protein